MDGVGAGWGRRVPTPLWCSTKITLVESLIHCWVRCWGGVGRGIFDVPRELFLYKDE